MGWFKQMIKPYHILAPEVITSSRDLSWFNELVQVDDKTLPHPGSQGYNLKQKSHGLVQADDKTLPHPGSQGYNHKRRSHGSSWFK